MSIEGVLAYRAQVVDTLRAEIAAVARQLEQARVRLSRIEAEADREARRFAQTAGDGMTAGEAAAWHEALAARMAGARAARAEVAELETRQRQIMADLMQARRAHKQAAWLVERAAERQRALGERNELRAADETAGRRYHAARRGERRAAR